MDNLASINSISFVCPKCKHLLHSVDSALHCSDCDCTYPIISGIPDFISGKSQERLTPVLRKERQTAIFFNTLAPVYESQLWEKFFLKLAGARGASSRDINSFHSKSLENITGSILDVACGPATHGRRIASPSKIVYGIDISMGMLQQGMKYVRREQVSDVVHLARARVDELPFESSVFDGVICSGSLHLFPDTLHALCEIARTMKSGAILSVRTFTTKNTARKRGTISSSNQSKRFHAFELHELQEYLTEAGFEEFQYKQDGTSIAFNVRKANSRS